MNFTKAELEVLKAVLSDWQVAEMMRSHDKKHSEEEILFFKRVAEISQKLNKV